MPRTFTRASSEKIDLSLGAFGTWGNSGGWTMAALVRRSADSGVAENIIQFGNTDGGASSLRILATNVVQMRLLGNQSSATFTLTTAMGWCLLIGSRSQSGGSGNLISLSKYVYGTNTWTHETGIATGGWASPTGANGIGYRVDNGAAFFGGDIALAGAWTGELTQAQKESLAFSLPAWFQLAPSGLWVLDQSSTSMLVNDLTGNGANQSGITGTAVSTNNVPVFSYGAPIITVDDFTASTVTGTSATTNANDTSTASGGTGPSGTLARTNANDTSTASGAHGVSGSSSTTNADDSCSASGTVTSPTLYSTTCALLTEDGKVLLTEDGQRLILEECIIEAPAHGGHRVANPRALADAQSWRDHLIHEDEEILCLI